MYYNPTVLVVLAPCLVVFGGVSCSACPYLAGQPEEQTFRREEHNFPNRESVHATDSDRDSLVEPHRILIFPFLSDFFQSIVCWFQSLFGGGCDSLTPVTSVDQALQRARADIRDILDDDLQNQIVRLAFHDCVGGCDGCVDLDNPENFGLRPPVDALEPIFSRYQEFLSRADIWVLAAFVANERAQGDNGGNLVTFDMQFYGRQDCSDPTGGPDRSLPSAHFTTDQVLSFFQTNFDFSAQETVAIMGAHTLGDLVDRNSGFDCNGWVRNENRLNNDYYQQLLSGGTVDPNWMQDLQDNTEFPEFPNQFLWERDRICMLNADMALVVNLDGVIDSTTGAVTCDLGGGGAMVCPPSSLLSQTAQYADNNGLWLQDYRNAFIKMTNKGCESGACTAL